MGNFTDFANSAGGTAAIGAGLGLVNNVSNLILGRAMQKQQLKGYKESLAAQNAAAYDMWQKTNYSAQVRELKEAGLNPGLLYGMGGAGGGTMGGGGAMPQAGGGSGMDVAAAAQLGLIKAQTDNIKADTENKRASTGNITQETANKVLDGVLKNYMNKNAERDWNIREETQLDEYGAVSNELEARKWIGANIIKLGEEGKLYSKSIEELEGLIQANAKSRAERKNIEKNFDILVENLKGAKIENVMKELEMRLQKETGLDRNSPYYMKILGRLFVELMGGTKN